MPKKRIPTAEELKMIEEMNNKHYSYKEIAQQLRCNYETLKRIMNDYNIQKKKNSRKNHFLKEDFFEKIDSEEKAYLLGLLKTDGFIKKGKDNRQSRWGVSLKESDKILLEQIKAIINSDSILSKDNRKGKECYSLEITNEKMCDDLAKYEILPNKTYFLTDIHLEQIPEIFRRHYLRGLLDGDGSIFIEKRYNQIGISFTGYNENFVYSFQQAIDSILNRKQSNKIQKANAYFCKWKGNIICKEILHYLYSDSNIFLPRKKEFYLNSIDK